MYCPSPWPVSILYPRAVHFLSSQGHNPCKMQQRKPQQCKPQIHQATPVQAPLCCTTHADVLVPTRSSLVAGSSATLCCLSATGYKLSWHLGLCHATLGQTWEEESRRGRGSLALAATAAGATGRIVAGWERRASN